MLGSYHSCVPSPTCPSKLMYSYVKTYTTILLLRPQRLALTITHHNPGHLGCLEWDWSSHPLSRAMVRASVLLASPRRGAIPLRVEPRVPSRQLVESTTVGPIGADPSHALQANVMTPGWDAIFNLPSHVTRLNGMSRVTPGLANDTSYEALSSRTWVLDTRPLVQ